MKYGKKSSGNSNTLDYVGARKDRGLSDPSKVSYIAKNGGKSTLVNSSYDCVPGDMSKTPQLKKMIDHVKSL